MAILVAYDYLFNAILWVLIEPINNFESGTACSTFSSIFKTLEKRSCKPTFNVLDNQASYRESHERVSPNGRQSLSPSPSPSPLSLPLPNQPMSSPITQPRQYIRLQQTNIISQEAINFITLQVYLKDTNMYASISFFTKQPTGTIMPDLEQFASPRVVHP